MSRDEQVVEQGGEIAIVVPREMPVEQVERLLASSSKLVAELHAAGIPARLSLDSRAPFAPDAIRVVSPAFSSIREVRPSFLWETDDPDSTFAVLVSDAEGHVVLSSAVAGCVLPYPAYAPGLVPGTTYFWRVQRSDDPTKVSEEAYFEVLSSESAADLESALRTARMLNMPPAEPLRTASLLMTYRLYDEARIKLEEHLRQAPADSESRDYLAAIYMELGWTWELHPGHASAASATIPTE